MNALNHGNWLKDLEAYQRCRDSLLSRSPTHRPDREPLWTGLAEWFPSIGISQTGQEYLIRAELPQFAREDLKISAELRTLTIVGQRRFEKTSAENPEGLAPIDGSFGRTFLLPKDASPSRVSAEFKDGVLIVRLLKGEPASPERIEVPLS